MLYALLDVAGFSGRNTDRNRLFRTMAKNLMLCMEVGYVEDLLCEGAADAARHTQEAVYLKNVYIALPGELLRAKQKGRPLAAPIGQSI